MKNNKGKNTPLNQKYQNFNLALYCAASTLEKITERKQLSEKYSFFEKHLSLNKIYLETYRTGVTIPREKMEWVIDFFREKGLAVAGGITPTTEASFTNLPPRLLGAFCYNQSEIRKRIKKISTYTASLFDEFILDDFFFTNCTCQTCIEKKGKRSWEEYRLQLMTEVSKNLIVEPAKKENPDVRVIIKYPNWIESFQQTGYNTETQPDIFDSIYTGTETRDSKYTHQHLPRYGSYSLMRWMENVKPGQNDGGWFDRFDCQNNLNHYLEQAYLTVFARARELMLFSFGSLLNTVFVPALGHELKKLDTTAGALDSPRGIAVYEPHHARGEDHLYDYLAMNGLPFEPVPFFPKEENTVFLTKNSTKDSEIINKLKNHLHKGKNAIITSGFLKEMQNKGIQELTSAKHTGQKVNSDLFAIMASGCSFENYYRGSQNILLPVLNYKNNNTWPLAVTINGNNSFPLLLKDHYGKGTLYTLTIPDNFADFEKYPAPVLTLIRKKIMEEQEVYLGGRGDICLFLYDNNTFIIESFRPHNSSVKIHIKGNSVRLFTVPGKQEIKKHRSTDRETVFRVDLQPAAYQVFRFEK